MARMKALCVFTTLLGNKTFTSRFVRALDGFCELEPSYVFLNVDDYRAFPAPWWARATNAWHVQFIAQQKARTLARRQKFDLLLVNCWEFVVAFRDFAYRVPAAAVMDATPASMNFQLEQRGVKGWKRSLSHLAHHRNFAKAAKAFNLFLPRGSDCAESLQRDYGIAEKDCSVVLAPQDLETWTPRPRSPSTRIRLLFVGNDFARKGGDFLLDLYTERLRKSCSLTIVSNDPAVANKRLPSGVVWVQGKTREQMLELYRSSDIFVLPTTQDFMPEVLGEALAVGLPCLATDIGGIHDLIKDGENGFLLPRATSTELWAERILHLTAKPAKLERMSKCARQFAEQMLSEKRFQDLVKDLITRLGTQTRKSHYITS